MNIGPAEFYYWGAIALLILSGIIFVATMWITAPYGRYVRTGWGPLIGARLGWIIMELPAPVCFVFSYVTGDYAWTPAALILGIAFLVHYVNRTIVFPLQMRSTTKKNPISMILIAAVFNSVNGLLCGFGASQFGPRSSEWLADPRFIVGMLIFIAGAAINVHSDSILRNLRKPGESGYRIPKGGLYRWVTSPNYFGEIVEWCGWALASWSLAGVAFAVFTAANLTSRAVANQRWYREEFPDYPAQRRTLIPGIW